MTSDAPSSPTAKFAKALGADVACPWCESTDAKLSSPFGGTISEILFQCRNCGETFGWMKWEGRTGMRGEGEQS